MKKIAFIFLCVLQFQNLQAQSITTLRIDPDNGRGGKTADIFEKVKFIPLETTKESIFGQIYTLEVTDQYFIINDHETYAVLIFERSGKFHAKIKMRTVKEYFGEFTLNRNANEIILPVVGNKVLIYNYDGKFLREENLLEDNGRIHYFNNNSVAININRPLQFNKKNEQKYDLIYSNGFNKIEKQLLPYNAKYVKYEYNLPENLFSPQDDGTCFFAMPYDYTISQLNAKGIVHQYKFNFPIKYALPNNFATDSSFTGKRKDYIFTNGNENPNNIIELSPFFKDNKNDYLLFHVGKIRNAFNYTEDFLYSLKKQTLYALNRVSGDSTSSNIPVVDSHFSEKIHYFQNQQLYSSIPASMLFSIKKSDKNAVKYSPELENLFDKGSKSDNPVIIEAKIKSGL